MTDRGSDTDYVPGTGSIEVDTVGYSSAHPNGNSQGGTYSWGGDTLGGALSFPGSLPPAYANPAWGSPPALSVFDYSTTLDFPTGTNGGNPSVEVLKIEPTHRT